jgi:MoaA/NifB/PqqE/SkfB family radical SAM enzyme
VYKRPVAGWKVILTGGEPLLRPDLETIVRACADLDTLVDLNSNLTLLTPERAQRLKDAGIGEVSVSVHGDRAAHDWLSDQAGCYDRTVKGIEMLLALGIPVDVHSALWDGMLAQVLPLADLCQQLGIGSLTFFRILPSAHAPLAPDAFTLTPSAALERSAARAKPPFPSVDWPLRPIFRVRHDDGISA